VQQFDDNTNLVVLQIKFPISLITHLNLTNDSSVVISTNRGTIVTCIKLHGDSYTGIKYAGVMLKQHSIDSSTAIFVEKKCNSLALAKSQEPEKMQLLGSCEEPRSDGKNEL
jgi:hypothetical protein